ncbi:disease resistance protein At4g27190-like [Rosa rugosa]|uniref:disease resistance protein At4g27190-like n=1 Tax=Rosa rugosa TaxID=74645 RepID=UPI002B4071C4|nr:disease resistance protein At4g27190-like [Rosa rugosa]XP_062026990.1 disease resistance protein At4g27190-like [Rosa rugosa]XP_062026991.1 disease resistance protein At4g27190-like [Rosa rugosa]XP_062026992.1 disease resistance protein At4g27190-like [Rosa rugosa]XP_062026993.1 disease resistance protein At4g27190-like [Rosa rugosa]XP_062026994.1 disease resistance protein At4g27190-like [Rosa rugosa]
MEILAAIAGKLAEFTVAPIGRQVGYLAHHKSNHQNLQTKLEDLSAARDEVRHKVDQFRRGGKGIETAVLNWKTRVDAIITESEEFLRDGRHAQTECLHGFCPHLVLRYQLSRKSAKLVEKINELHGKKEFSNFAYDVLPQDLCLLSTGHYSTFDSRNSVVLRVMDELRNPDTEMILVWGIGGVGKTTLVEEVLRQAKDVNLFDDLVMVRDVKENPDLEKIQKEIAMKLGMSIDEKHTLAERAPLLGDRIKQKRTLVVLDDVWEKIDLLAVGVPRLVNLKVLLTCRSRKELSLDMRTQKDISVDVLNEKEAWSLFEKMAGDVVKDSRIRSVAIEVAKKCGGLPVLIVTVARALKDRNKLHHWNDTLRRLRGFDNKELTEKAYLALEWSYDQLEDKELKPLFLLCGIIVVKNHIYLTDLLKYGFGLDLIKNVNKIEDAREALYTLVDKLKDSCLLLDSDINMHVRMHDLVCEVATQIASRDRHVLSVEYGGELKEWPDKDFFERCSKMSLKSSNIPMLSEVPWECPKLEMFHLYEKSIPSNFFSEMEKLKVLGLTEVWMMSLPPSLQLLKNLQTLCLEECWLKEVALVGHLSNLEFLSFARSNINQLPKEIGQLIRLRWLDLSDCVRLRVISPGVISRLERLEDLSLRNVFLKWEAERGGSNASLLELKDLSQLTALEIYIEDANILPSYLFSSRLVRYQIHIGNVWKHGYERKKTMAETTLNTLKLKLAPSDELDHGIKTLLKKSEDLSLDGTESVKSIARQLHVEDFQQLIHLRLQNNVDFTYIINRKVVFPNLTTLSICRCDHLSFLFSFSMAKSLVELKHLEVSRCAIMEEIVSARDQSNGENIDIKFCKLESLILDKLPNITGFCTESCTEFSPVTKFDTEPGASIFDPTSSKKLDVENETVVRACLFDAQVKFPSLERLKIDGLGKLHALWNNKFADQDSFCQLKEVEVTYCNSLKKIFPVSVARRLQKLHSLYVSWCVEVEEIITGEQGLETESPHLVLPKVTRVTFSGLPKLSRFYLGIIASKWPLLKQLYISGCGKVKMFAAELPISSERHEPNPLIEQSLFLIDKDSFPNLEVLTLEVAGEIWYGPSSSPAHFFPKLKTIRFVNWATFSKQAAIHFLEKLPNLEVIQVGWDDVSTEIFVNEEINGLVALGNGNSAVKTLAVRGMPKLLQLGNGNSQTAGPLFPNLDALYVFSCKMLKSVESSAISFRNLTTLRVDWCFGLEYLTSYSVAQSLMQLTTLGVNDCGGLRAIIGASNEDDHDTGATCEIAFTRLQHLTLLGLPRLQGFCSGNCIVKLPSSTELDVRGCPIELKISSEGVLLSNRNPEIAEEVDDNDDDDDDDGENEKDEDVGTSLQDIEDRQE